jgi:homocitrate synthase NifV
VTVSRATLCDTTLRDGGQAPGYAFSLATRVRLAGILDAAGVTQIEAGVPVAGKNEVETIRAVRDACARARISGWNRARPEDVRASLACGVDIVHICLPVAPVQMSTKLGLSPDAAVRRYLDCVRMALDGGAVVVAGLEDVSRAEPAFMVSLAERLREEGVMRVRLSDTVGVLTPARTQALVRRMAALGLEVEIHAHDDLGMALANSLCAVLAGATVVDTTLGGIGERAGNCPMGAFVHVASLAGLETDVTWERAAQAESEASPMLRRDEAGAERWSMPWTP